MANSVDPDQTAPIGAVCSGSTLFASILNSSVILGNNVQQTTSADDFFRCIFLGALRVKVKQPALSSKIVSEYDQEIPQPQAADSPTAPQGRAAQPSRDTRKTNQGKQPALSSPSRWLQY